MKNLIRKILKENEDEFEWARGLDVEAAEKEVYQPFKKMAYEWDVDAKGIYDTIIKFGIRQPSEVRELGDFLFDEFERIYDKGRDHGYDDGISSCDCDGCCDDYVYIDEHSDEVNRARDEGDEEGYERGFSDGRGESEDEIEELKGQIQELQATIEELRYRDEG